MADLSAASYEDVVDFFKKWYGPANASIVIAGDVDAKEVRALAEKWFGEIPKSDPVAPLAPRPVVLTEEKSLRARGPGAAAPRLSRLADPGRLLAAERGPRRRREPARRREELAPVQAAGVRTAGRAGRHRLPGRGSRRLRLPGDRHRPLGPHPRRDRRPRGRGDRPAAGRGAHRGREIVRFQNRTEAAFFDGLERVGGFGGKADQLNDYYVNTGNPDYFEEDLARYRA